MQESINISMGRKLNTEVVIERFKSVHGDRYDYSNVNYIRDSDKLHIICREHGSFYQSHLQHFRSKQGCPKCGRISQAHTHLNNLSNLVADLPQDIREQLDFSESKYTGMHNRFKVRCIKHNETYNAHPADIFYTHEIYCSKCKEDKFNNRKKSRSITLYKELTSKAKDVHNNRYEYGERTEEFRDIYSKIDVKCPVHGWYKQTASDHVYGKHGCPICRSSQGENIIKIFLDRNNVDNVYQHRVRIGKSFHWFDFYLPLMDTMIEYNGKQHYIPIKWFGGIKMYEYTVSRDSIKKKYCGDNNIRLITISYKDRGKIDKILEEELSI